MTDRPIVLRPGDGQAIDLGNFAMSVMATAAHTGDLYTPAAMVGYFYELSAAIAADQAYPDTLAATADRHGMEVRGDIPEGYL